MSLLLTGVHRVFSAGSSGMLASDDFNRANAGNLGANWTQMKGISIRISVVSNQAASGTGGSRCGDYYSATSAPNDQYSQAGIVALGDVYTAVIARAITSGTQRNHYAAGQNPNDFGTQSRIWKEVANTITSVATGSTSPAGGQTWYLSCIGTALKMQINGVDEINTTDASLSSGQFGLLCFDTTASKAIFDNWEGGAP